jgi:hypothetical protein
VLLLKAPTHYEETLQRDIHLIRSKVLAMSQLADRALRDSLRELVEKNLTLAYSVILRDQYIDELEKELDRLCLEFLVRQQPVAGHLRMAYATIKINLELERIGDYVESVARQVLKVSSNEKLVHIQGLTNQLRTSDELKEGAIQMPREIIKTAKPAVINAITIPSLDLNKSSNGSASLCIPASNANRLIPIIIGIKPKASKQMMPMDISRRKCQPFFPSLKKKNSAGIKRINLNTALRKRPVTSESSSFIVVLS